MRHPPLADVSRTPLHRRDAGARRGEPQRRLRAARQDLGVPPLDHLIAGIAEAHGASILHDDADFDRLATHTDLAAPVEPLAPLGTLP